MGGKGGLPGVFRDSDLVTDSLLAAQGRTIVFSFYKVYTQERAPLCATEGVSRSFFGGKLRRIGPLQGALLLQKLIANRPSLHVCSQFKNKPTPSRVLKGIMLKTF